MTGTEPGDATRADAGSLLRRIEHGASGSGTITFLGSAAPDGVAECISWGQLHEDAQGVAAALQARGVAPGDHVAILGPTSRPLVTMIQATWLAGATVVCLPLPMRLGSIEEFASQTRRRVLNANARLVVVDPELEPFLALEPGDPPVVRLDEVRARAGAWERPLDDPDALGILQFTSGSTDDPKGVMLPQRCLVANIDAILEGAGLGPDDVGVSWLPLYHDMGLIGLLTTPMVTGFDLGLAPPQDFLAGPADWMRWISQMRATAGVEGVRAGNVIAFGAEGRRGREGIVVVAETKGDDLSALRAEVVARVCDVVGIPPRDVVLVRPGSLPKTFVGQAPAFAVSHAVSRRHARTRLISLH